MENTKSTTIGRQLGALRRRRTKLVKDLQKLDTLYEELGGYRDHLRPDLCSPGLTNNLGEVATALDDIEEQIANLEQERLKSVAYGDW